MPFHRARHRSALLVLLCVLTIVGLAAPSWAAGSPTPLSSDEQRANDLVAATRRSAKAPALQVCADLTAIARRWSQQMASTGTLAHNPRARDEISGWSAWGENVGVGSSVDQVHGALVKSPKHLANLESSTFAHVGVGVAQGGGRTWVTQVFRSPKTGQGCPVVGSAAPEGLPQGVARVEGADRYATATALSRTAFDRASTVIVASASRFPDALAAAPLSARLGAPVLLTGGDTLQSATKQEIQRLGASKAVVLGSTATLSARIDRDLGALGLSVRRISGADRYATAATIAAEVGGTRVVLARGDSKGWADAIAASAYAAFRRMPVILVDGTTISSPARSALDRLGVESVDIIGGTSAVSARIEAQLRDAGISTRRIAGSNRLETSAKVADASVAAGMSSTRVWLATSRNWADALAAGPAVARDGGLLLLADPSRVHSDHATASWLARHRDTVDHVVLVGGRAAVGDRVGHDVAAILR